MPASTSIVARFLPKNVPTSNSCLVLGDIEPVLKVALQRKQLRYMRKIRYQKHIWRPLQTIDMVIIMALRPPLQPYNRLLGRV